MIEYVLQVKHENQLNYIDTVSSWYPGSYDDDLFHEMLKSNLAFAKRVYPNKEFRIIRRISTEEIIY